MQNELFHENCCGILLKSHRHPYQSLVMSRKIFGIHTHCFFVRLYCISDSCFSVWPYAFYLSMIFFCTDTSWMGTTWLWSSVSFSKQSIESLGSTVYAELHEGLMMIMMMMMTTTTMTMTVVMVVVIIVDICEVHIVGKLLLGAAFRALLQPAGPWPRLISGVLGHRIWPTLDPFSWQVSYNLIIGHLLMRY